MTKRTRIALGSAAAVLLATGTGLAIGWPAMADNASLSPSSSIVVEDGTNDGETNDDGAVEDGTDDGETNDDGAVEDGTDDGETNDD